MPPRLKKTSLTEKTPSSNYQHNIGLAQPGRPIPKSKSSPQTLQLNSHHSNSPNALVESQSKSVDDCHVNGTGLNITNGSVDEPLKSPMYPVCRNNSNVINNYNLNNNINNNNNMLGEVEAYPTNPLRIDLRAKSAVHYAYPTLSKNYATTTILSACPIWDVVAILLVLLQLPNHVITIVQFLFAAITFVPASTTASLTNIPNIQEVLIGLAGPASIHAMLGMDVITMFALMIVWTPVQNIALDLASVIIALSLGGATGSKVGTRNSLLWCILVIALSHLFRLKSVRQLLVDTVWKILESNGLWVTGPAPQLLNFESPYTAHSWFRCLLGFHILAQGIFRLVRRWILLWQQKEESKLRLAEQSPSTTPKLASISSVSSSPNPDIAITSSGSTDGRTPGLPPLLKDRLSSGGRKRKKISHSARLQQPFWAAIASTKVNVSKDHDQLQTTMDSKSSGSVDLHNMGDTDFESPKCRVWITNIGSYDMSFGICLPISQEDNESQDSTTESLQQESNLWYIRINRARWESVKKTSVAKIRQDQITYEQWEGVINGLAPSGSFHCEFLWERDHEAIFETTIVTQKAPTNTETATIVIQNPVTLQHHPSPATALRSSIQAVDSDVGESRNQLKISRKQHKTAGERLQSQIDREKSKLVGNSGPDDRQKQRLKQLETLTMKHNIDEKVITQSMKDLGSIPQEDKDAFEQAKKDVRDRQRRMDVQKSNFNKSKKEADKQVTSAQNELQSIFNKRIKLEAKEKDRSSQLADLKQKEERSRSNQAFKSEQNSNWEHFKNREAEVYESRVIELCKMYQNEVHQYNCIVQEAQQYEEAGRRMLSQAGLSAPGTPENQNALPSFPQHNTSTMFNAGHLSSSSVPSSRPQSLHLPNGFAGFTPNFTFPTPIGTGKSLHGRKRSNSLEVESSPHHNNIGLIAPPTSIPLGLSSFPNTSSSALLPNTTALLPMSHVNHVSFPGLGLAPVGEGRGKGNDGSYKEDGIFGYKENGSPQFGGNLNSNSGNVNGHSNGSEVTDSNASTINANRPGFDK